MTSQTTNEPILYQVDCAKASSGKTVSITKRRIRWRYGFANPTAISNGATSVDCRGSEHEITLVWSITSGKKLVVHDSQEVHYSQGRRAEGKFQFCWKARDHVFTVIAHAAPPLGKAKGQWKQFDLLIDGRSFDALPRIYQLGPNVKVNSAHRRSARVGSYGHGGTGTHAHAQAFAAPRSNYDRRSDSPSARSPQDEMKWARSIHSIETRRQMNANVASRDNSSESAGTAPPQDLLSDNHYDVSMDPNSPRDLLSEPAVTPVSVGGFTSSSAEDASAFAYDQNDEFVPQNDQFNPQVAPSYDAIWSSIMDAYDSGVGENPNSAPVANAGETHTAMPVVSTSMHAQTHSHPLTIDTNVDKLGKDQQSMESPTDVTALGALGNLVNLDDISQPVLKEYNRGAMNKNEDASRKHLSLRELKKENKAPTKEIMKTHVVYAQNNPGALVVYGQPQQQQQYNNYGPPPLAVGFGVGATYR
jgi:hypothetical protein